MRLKLSLTVLLLAMGIAVAISTPARAHIMCADAVGIKNGLQSSGQRLVAWGVDANHRKVERWEDERGHWTLLLFPGGEQEGQACLLAFGPLWRQADGAPA